MGARVSRILICAKNLVGASTRRSNAPGGVCRHCVRSSLPHQQHASRTPRQQGQRKSVIVADHMTDTPPSIITRSTERKVAYHLPSPRYRLSHPERFNRLDHQEIVATSPWCRVSGCRSKPARSPRGGLLAHAELRSVRANHLCGLPRRSKIVHNRVHFNPLRGLESRRNAGVRFLPRGPSAHGRVPWASTPFERPKQRRGCADQVRARRLQIDSCEP